MRVTNPNIVGGLSGGLAGAVGSTAAPAFSRATLTGHYLATPAYAMPAETTIVSFHIPVAIDTGVGNVASCIDTSNMYGWLMRWSDVNTLQCGGYRSTTPSFVSTTFTSTGAVGGGTRLFCWMRVQGTTLSCGVGRPSDITISSTALAGGLRVGTPSQVGCVFARPELATHDLRATNLQLGVWDSALSDAQLDAIGTAADLRAVAVPPDRWQPVPTVGVGVAITQTYDVRDAVAPSRVWTPTGSGTDLTGATLT